MKLILGVVCVGVGYLIGVFSGFYIEIYVMHFWRKFLLKIRNNSEEVLDTLNLDTQIILKQYMEKTDHYGEDVYIVKDIKLFDTLIQNHNFNKFDNYGCNHLDYCIKESLSNGNGFIVFVNGEQYVAIRPPVTMDADCFIKRPE